MDIKINGKNIKITQAMKDATNTKLKVLEKFIGENNVSVIVTTRKH